ncbi:hypothetical protein HPB50_012644 [Hyalomma asiaticum]|uniref:Uncharacterized protein n=1 Tax=Hyalomma asiaticum TaxID=266040 RepID=A0ACB7SVP3_HYAAI|nr:hypothetical protein HPB50_012644 [Hyalomma asiaticum]
MKCRFLLFGSLGCPRGLNRCAHSPPCRDEKPAWPLCRPAFVTRANPGHHGRANYHQKQGCKRAVEQPSIGLLPSRTLLALRVFLLADEVIAWPNDEQRANAKAGFLSRSKGKGPRNTIGCIDGCHIEIPHQKGICDANSRFIDIFVGSPGCSHDARAAVKPHLRGCRNEVLWRLFAGGLCLPPSSMANVSIQRQ